MMYVVYPISILNDSCYVAQVNICTIVRTYNKVQHLLRCVKFSLDAQRVSVATDVHITAGDISVFCRNYIADSLDGDVESLHLCGVHVDVNLAFG